MLIYLLLLALPVSSEFSEVVRFKNLGTTVFKIFTPDHLALEIDLNDYLLTAREYGGAIRFTRNCSRPVKISFEKCGTKILETSFTTKADNLTFQDAWIHHLIATLREKCYDTAPDLMTITLNIFARTDTNCIFTFRSIKPLEETRMASLSAHYPMVHVDPETLEKTEILKTDVSTQQNRFTSSVLLETTSERSVNVAIGKCGYQDPYKMVLNVSDYTVLNTLNRMSALMCDLDRTHTFDTLIFSDVAGHRHFHYRLEENLVKLYVVMVVIPILIVLNMFLFLYAWFHFVHGRSPVIVFRRINVDRTQAQSVPILTKVQGLTPRMIHF